MKKNIFAVAQIQSDKVYIYSRRSQDNKEKECWADYSEVLRYLAEFYSGNITELTLVSLNSQADDDEGDVPF